MFDHWVYVEDMKTELPTCKMVCPRCNGEGSHSKHLGTFTAEEMYEQGEEFREDYIAGKLDKMCEICKGLRVVDTVDENASDPTLYRLWVEQESERLMESWGTRKEILAGC